MKNYDVIRSMLKNHYATGSNLVCDGDTIINYKTVIARITSYSKKTAELNTRKYSATTTRNQNMIRDALESAGYTITEYYGPAASTCYGWIR